MTVTLDAGQSHDLVLEQLRGNLPQAFVHAAMLECAITLSPDAALGRDQA